MTSAVSTRSSDNYVITLLTKDINSDKLELVREWTDSCVSTLKKYESFSPTIYLDNDNSETIGYGHHISKNESFPSKISVRFADSLLRRDFDSYVTVASKYTSHPYKKLAIGMFLYNFGETKFNSYRISYLVKKDMPIDDEIIKYNKFTHNGIKKESKSLKERRLFELKTYNMN